MAETEPFGALRRVIPFLSVGILIAALYVGWVFYSRWNSNREAEAAAKTKEVEEAKRTVEMLGGGKFKILAFYAYPGLIRSGEEARICYGVSGANNVRIEPPVEELKPSLSRCFNAKLRKTTQFRLIAEDAAGHTATESFTLKVR
jgi:hypothetical protein